MERNKTEVKFEIEKQIAMLSRNEKSGWTKQLNLIAWNGAPAKYDIRDWNDDKSKMSKGITLTEEEADELRIALGNAKF